MKLKWGKSIQQFQRYAFRKFGPLLWQTWQVFGPRSSPYGANWQMTMTVYNNRPRQIHSTSDRENPSSGYRHMGSVTTIPVRTGELRGKLHIQMSFVNEKLGTLLKIPHTLFSFRIRSTVKQQWFKYCLGAEQVTGCFLNQSSLLTHKCTAASKQPV